MSNALLYTFVVISAVVLSTLGQAEELPEMRPALIGNGPKALINIIDAQALLQKGQADAAVMFPCLLEADGQPMMINTYRWTPGGETLEREVYHKLVEARFIPAIYHHRRTPADLYGTVIFRRVDGKARLRIFLNQDKSELANESDFIAPQVVASGFPRYPITTFLGGDTGTVVLKLNLDASGKRKNVSVESETPTGHQLGQSVLEMFKRYDFIPAYRNGKPVDSSTTLTVYFKGR
ncbi:MAG: TonB family protein [Verrucomicrobia bacterium]|nr:TonB family protein [Verrucomicrobiota bacterium]